MLHNKYYHILKQFLGDVAWGKLDYLFSNSHFLFGSAMVHQDVEHGGMETLSRSDHAPLTATWEVGP